MKKALYLYAIISSPILAIYGVSPFYIFDKITLSRFLSVAVGLSINIFLVWLINIYLTLKHSHLKNWQKFLLSCFSNFVFQFFFSTVEKIFLSRPDFTESGVTIYVTHPFITSVVFNAIIIMLCNSIVTVFKKSQAEQEVQQLKFQNSEAEKQILLQQLQPHFLFNSLSVLKSLIKEKPDEAEDYTLKLSEFLRYSVKAPTRIAVPLEDEIEFTLGYIELQKVRFEKAFLFTLDIPPEAFKLKIPVYALQVLVENAFKHNYFTEKKPLNLHIVYKDKTLRVSNNKENTKVVEKPSGTGLINLNQRHLLITGKEIEVKDEEGNFSVILQLLPA